MRTQVYIWLIISALAGILASCNSTPNYDNRLIKADVLMHNHPDEAINQINAIDPNSLKASDRAFYDLLLVQASYLTYVDFLNDSTNWLARINSTLSYYSQHPKEREKLTRAYIYKGAIMNEFGKPDSAMWYYKQAEYKASKEPIDHFNLGYANYSMGKLYSNYHAIDGIDIEKLKKAVENFKQTDDNIYQIISLKELASAFRRTQTDSSIAKLNEAIEIAKSIKDPGMVMACTNDLAASYYFNCKYKNQEKDKFKAHKEIQNILASEVPLNSMYYISFAKVYALLNKPDSAQHYINKVDDRDTQNNTNYLEALIALAHAEKDSTKEMRYIIQQKNISEPLLANPVKVMILLAELDCDEKHNQELGKEQEHHNTMIRIIIGLIILSLLALTFYLYRRSHRYDNLVLELRDQSSIQINNLSGLQENMNELKINDERLKSFIASNMGMMREMIEACYHEPNNRIAENMKRIVKFQDSNRDNWVKVYDYIDMEHNNIMTRTRDQYPQLNDRDLLLLALSCMGFTYIQTAIIMGYSNATSVSVIKQRLAKKMGLDCTLNEYIEWNEKQK